MSLPSIPRRLGKPLIESSHSCKPQIAQTIMSEPGMKEALEGKLLISILAGVTIAQLQAMVLPSTKVVRAMPNTPCKVRVPFSLGHLTDLTLAHLIASRSVRA